MINVFAGDYVDVLRNNRGREARGTDTTERKLEIDKQTYSGFR